MVVGSDLRRGTALKGRGPGAAGRGTAVAAALVLILAPALAACSDDNGGGKATPSATRTTSAAPVAPADPAAAQKEIKENWQKFFDPATPVQAKLAVLQNGDRMAPVLQAFSGDQRSRQAQAQVTKVTFTSPTRATVTYDLVVRGATALPNASGTAIQESGTWKVSDSTLCALIAMSGNASASAIPGC
ncbi:hypothetical protein C3489_29960 [Streptomyces sp. Ru71]|uniref:hypothetical protein n=1 Tax=Streptomyces sp. Ru71 TaxID=2080746 RepID=UPI000CDE03C4|nr:hypothetical protein [Streptomyces sp. Ru71]POX47322.1 hypothetical protein C3489_29960 [Streptomyces sp. Ru71]